MRLQLFLLLLVGPLLSSAATTWFCFCGVQYFTDPQCLFPVTYGIIREYQNLCMNNTFPLGSWAVQTNPASRNIIAAMNNSYLVQSCLVSPAWIIQFFNGVGCEYNRPMGPPMALATDEVCRGPYLFFGDLLWTRVTCGAYGLSLSLSLLIALVLVWVGFYSL